jgi:putative colanic acid biosynthesis glycosyltransferase
MTVGPSVSIVTACLNSVNDLPSCLDSVSCQEGVEVEHIVIDGGSSDGTVEWLSGREDPGLVWLSEPDSGIADAMNKGASMARGDWWLFLQADDQLHGSLSLSMALEQARVGAFDLIACGILFGRKLQLPVPERSTKAGWPLWTPFKQPFRHQGLLISKNAWERVGPYQTDFKITMDFDWMLRAYWAGIKAVRIGIPLADVGTGGISSVTNGSAYRLRLREEQRARLGNAPSRMWRFAYKAIWPLYLPYRLLKTRTSVA